MYFSLFEEYTSLTRVVIEYTLLDEKCPCCDGTLHVIKTNIMEQIHIIPNHAQVLRITEHDYTCRECEKQDKPIFIRASMQKPLIKGFIASPSKLAVVLTSKYVDGLPLYRLAEELNRSGIYINPTTLCNWAIKGADMLMPIYEALQQILLEEPLIHGDETRLQVLKVPGRKATSQSYMWVCRNNKKSEFPVVLFENQPGDTPTAILTCWSGVLMTDAYSALRMLKNVTFLGCFAHTRRKFNDIVKIKGQHSQEAKEAVDTIAKLYVIEKETAILT
ncbi:IS66 family transposase, partial [Thorsellia anophelis]